MYKYVNCFGGIVCRVYVYQWNLYRKTANLFFSVAHCQDRNKKIIADLFTLERVLFFALFRIAWIFAKFSQTLFCPYYIYRGLPLLLRLFILSHALNLGHIPNPYGDRCHNPFRLGVPARRSCFAEVSLSSTDYGSEECRFLLRSSMISLRIISPPFPVMAIEYPGSL